MNIVVLGIHFKGGAGNTTNCKLFYNQLKKENKKVCIVNTDPLSACEYEEYEKGEVFNFNDLLELKKEISFIKEEYEYIIIDTKPFPESIEEFNEYINLATYVFFTHRNSVSHHENSIFNLEEKADIQNFLTKDIAAKNIAFITHSKNNKKIIEEAIKTLLSNS